MGKIIFLLCITALCCFPHGYGQIVPGGGVTVKGRVVNESGGIAGAIVLIKGTTIETVTDANGYYSIITPDNSAILSFNAEGYIPQEIAVRDQAEINVTLDENEYNMNEIVVVGYGTQKRSSLTGSVVQVSSENLVRAPVGSTSNTLAGRLPGLTVWQLGGQPGMDGASLNIRGFGTPLILIDGMDGDLNNIDPYEIESVTVLKDAAASIYGSRGDGGVILVTTKRGKLGKPTISLNASYTWQSPTIFGKPVNAGQFAELQREEYINRGNDPATAPFTEEDIRKYFEGTDPAYPNADWWGAVMKDWTPQHQVNLSINGGTDRIKYMGSLGYMNQDLMYKAGGNYYRRYNIRSNIDARINKNLTMTLDFTDIIEIRKYPNRADDQIWNDLFNAEPIWYTSYPDETKVPYSGDQLMNPIVNTSRDIGGYRDTETHSIKSTLGFEYKAPWVEGLSLKALGNYSKYFLNYTSFMKEAQLWKWDYQSDTYTLAGTTPSTNLTQVSEWSSFLTGQFSANFQRTFAKHHDVTAMILFEVREGNSNHLEGRRIDFATTTIPYLFAGSENSQYTNSWASETGNLSYLGRLTYAYKEKYLMEATFRYDASAAYKAGEQWEFFPSVSVGWRISEENFVKNNADWLTNLKIRGGIGQTGNDRVAYFQYLSAYQYNQTYLLGDTIEKGLLSTGAANPYLSWERQTIYNLGLDFGIGNGLLYGEMDVFYRNRTGIPATRTSSVPLSYGETFPLENLNSINTRGFEVMLGHSRSYRDFSWDIRGNVAWSRSKWGHYEEPEYTDPDQIKILKLSGQWTDLVWGGKTDGLFTSQEEIDNLEFDQDLLGNTTLAPGDIKYIDLNGDGILDWRDSAHIGNAEPHWHVGLDINLRYKGFDLSMLFQGALGGDVNVAIGGPAWVPQEYIYNERWTPENNDRNALVPRRGGANTNGYTSELSLRPTDYVRLKTLSFGYSFPLRWLSKVNLKTLRVYVSGTNLFTIDALKKYSLDPESLAGTGWYYPQSRTLSVGINLSF